MDITYEVDKILTNTQNMSQIKIEAEIYFVLFFFNLRRLFSILQICYFKDIHMQKQESLSTGSTQIKLIKA